MDANAIPAGKTFEEKYFKPLFCEATNENPFDRMEVLKERFPAKTNQQPSDQFDAFGDMLCGEIDVEPITISNGATSDSSDRYNLLGGDTLDSVLGPVEVPLDQPSKQLMVKVAGDPVTIKKPRHKSIVRRRQKWSTEEHRQFLHGLECFGRGKWKAISMYAVPSRTPAQLASHAQKYFKRIEKHELNDKRQRYTINDVKLVNHDPNNIARSGSEPEKVKPTESSIPPEIPTEEINFLDDLTLLDDMNFPDDLTFLDDMDFLDDMVEEMPTFLQASNNVTNIETHVTLNNGTPGSLQWEALRTCPTKEQGRVLLDQTGGMSAETRTGPPYGQSLGTGNQIRKDNIALPGVFTARTPPEVQHYGQGEEATTQ